MDYRRGIGNLQLPASADGALNQIARHFDGMATGLLSRNTLYAESWINTAVEDRRPPTASKQFLAASRPMRLRAVIYGRCDDPMSRHRSLGPSVQFFGWTCGDEW